MRSTDLDISRLSVAERIQLAEDLWDSVAAETGDLPLSEAQTAELDRRLADLERDPGAGESWPVVCARIETSPLRGADLFLGGDVVDGEERYLYYFRRVDGASG
jgi:putative addiction module component (TIGR02574 family)